MEGGGITSGIVSSLGPDDLGDGNLADVIEILVSIESWIQRNVN